MTFRHRKAISLPAICCLTLLLTASGARALPMTLQQTWLGETVSDQFGYAIASVGDFNGDGHEDFLVGANVNDHLVLSGGRVYLYLGGPSYPPAFALAFAGNVGRGYVGGALAGGADLNGDGYDDFAVGAPGWGTDDAHPGRVYVFYGGPTPDATPDLILDGTVPAGDFGVALTVVRDWNGDGFADLVVGAPRAGGGTVSVYLGGASGLPAVPAVVLHARAGDNRFGKALAWLPDRNGDGRDELLVGVPRSFQAAVWAGAVLLFDGAAVPDTVADLVLLGQNAGDEFGSSLAAGSDIDGDGLADILVGAPLANPAFVVDAGQTLLFGTSGGLNAVPDLVWSGTQIREHFGHALATGFDWDGDGQPDLAIGVPDRTSGGLTYAGEVEIHLGGVGLNTLPDALLSGGTAGKHWGTAVTPAGDLQGSLGSTLGVGGYNSVDAGQVRLYGRNEVTISAVPQPMTTSARLLPPWPNPANPATAVALVINDPGHWRLNVYDLAGRRVATLHDGELTAGQHTWRWQGRDQRGQQVASGNYLVRATSRGQQLVRGLTVVR